MRVGSGEFLDKIYGHSVRGQLLGLVHQISAAGSRSGISTQNATDEVCWKLSSAELRRGEVECQAVINGYFPNEFSIRAARLSLDDGDASLCVDQHISHGLYDGPFARDFLDVVTGAYIANEANFYKRAITRARPASETHLVNLRAGSSGETLTL